MQERVTIKDLARKTGTSVATVHRALHGAEGVGPELRQRILEEARRNHYRLDESASLLRRDPFNIVALLPRPSGNERFYYRGLWKGIYGASDEFEKLKVNLTCIESEFGVDEIAFALETLYDKTGADGGSIDGLITICDDPASRRWIQRFMRRGTKVALVDRGEPIDGVVCSVSGPVADMAQVAVEVVDLLRDKQRRLPILLVNGSKKRASYQVYCSAARGCLCAQGIGCAPELLEINAEDEQSTREQLSDILRRRPLGGIIAASARATYWVCEEVERHLNDPKQRPPVVGTDVFAEQQAFFESGTLRATICQSHTGFGPRALQYLLNSLVNLDVESGVRFYEPISIVMKNNFRFFL